MASSLPLPITFDAHIGSDGFVCLRANYPTGSSSWLAPANMRLEDLAAAAEAFNVTLTERMSQRSVERPRRRRAA